MAALLNWFGSSKPAASAAPPGRCLKRVARDVATVRRDHATNLFAEQREAVATTVDCVVCGPEGTPYFGGLFHFRVEHPHSYPVENPKCTNLTTGQGRIGFNPNLYRTGKVCMRQRHAISFPLAPSPRLTQKTHRYVDFRHLDRARLEPVALAVERAAVDPVAHERPALLCVRRVPYICSTACCRPLVIAATSARWRAVDLHATAATNTHRDARAGNEPGREGVARDDPTNIAYDAFLKYATLKYACVDVLDASKQGAEPLPAAARRFCAERFLERYDKILALVDAEIKAGTAGRLRDPARTSALGLGPVDYAGLRADLATRKAEAEALLATEEDDEGEEDAKEELSTPEAPSATPAAEAKDDATEPATPPREAP
jgi:ubiquitin-protein ligase